MFWGVGSLFTPESPRSLLAQGRRVEALATLARFRNLPPDHGYVQAEFAGIEAQLSHEAAVVAGAATADLFRETFAAAPNRRRFALIFMVQILGQWSGANAITQYSPTILGYLGVRGVEARLLATGCYAVVKLVATLLFSLLVVDLVGRRRSLLAGITLQIVTLAYIGGYLRVTAGWDAEEVNGSPSALAASRAAIAAIYLHAVAWSIGWFSIPFLVGSEVFPLRIRSVNVAALMAFHWANYFGCSRAMSSLLAATDRWGAFLFFMGVCIFSLVYVSMALPETSGRSLESMDRLFERPWYTVYKIAYPTADELRPEVRHVPEDDKGLVEPRHA